MIRQFAETRQRLDGLESAPAEHWWHDVVLDVRKACSSTAAHRQVPKQAESEGQDEESTKALGLTIPPAVLGWTRAPRQHLRGDLEALPRRPTKRRGEA